MNAAENSDFDAYASSYDEALNRGVSVTGEGRIYFAERRVRWLAAEIASLGAKVSRVVDFGCGTGNTSPLLQIAFGASQVLGLDISGDSLAIARQANPAVEFQFESPSSVRPSGEFDLVYSNGVVHHIPLKDRQEVLRYVYHLLRPGGYLAVWENNPWNPGTRFVMSRVAFDRDAVLVSAWALRRLLCEVGFEFIDTTFHFVFPRFLAWLRPLEGWMARLPVGGQYEILVRKPSTTD